MNLLKRLVSLSPEGLPWEINGETFHFHQLSLPRVGKAVGMFRPLLTHVAVLISKPNDNSTTLDQTSGPVPEAGGKLYTQVHQSTEPARLEVIQYRDSERRKATDALFGALEDDAYLDKFLQLVWWSLEGKDPTDQELETLRTDLPAATLVQCLQGVYEANKDAFAPFLTKTPDLTLVPEVDEESETSPKSPTTGPQPSSASSTPTSGKSSTEDMPSSSSPESIPTPSTATPSDSSGG